ncbi:MAG: ABC transporter ATP-binding protein [Lysinibacillus sp.]
MNILTFENVSKKYRRGKSALSNFTCTIEENKIIGIIGRNGAGKSTFLKIAAGHMKPTHGDCRIFTHNPLNSLLVSANTILIDDQLSFSDMFSLDDILKMGKDFYPNWQEDLAYRLLTYAGLSRSSKHAELSKGQLATFNLIYGLVSRCKLTLLDEPMNGMDEAIRTDFYRAILKEYIAYPRTILISSHHLHELEAIVEEIILIDEGTVVEHTSVEDLKQLLVALHGPADDVHRIISGATIYQEKTVGPHTSVIIEAKSLFIDEQQLKALDIRIQCLTASEVCMYSTAKGGGVIDDVFK